MSLKRHGLYTISIMAKLVGIHPQTLRLYERKELICPSRTLGHVRLYSDEDVKKLECIQELTQKHGVNLAGARMIMDLKSELEQMQQMISEMDKSIEELHEKMREEVEKVHRSLKQEIIHIPRGELMKK